MDIPQPPNITEKDLEECRKNNDFCPVLFEWYKYVGIVANYFASIQKNSPALISISNIHYSVLLGLLNRCARLMLANVALSHEGLFGETTAIIDRSIFESAIKLKWICNKGDDDSFNRFIAEGLKTEVEFKKSINDKIKERGGEKLEIEERMLNSVDNYIKKSELTEEQISGAKKLPDLASMINVVGKDRLAYIAGQKIGSHHVHGTWVSLWFHYLEEKDGIIRPRDHNCATHVNQYVYIPLVVLDSIKAFIEYVCKDRDDAKGAVELLRSISKKILQINSEVVGSDFDTV